MFKAFLTWLRCESTEIDRPRTLNIATVCFFLLLAMVWTQCAGEGVAAKRDTPQEHQRQKCDRREAKRVRQKQRLTAIEKSDTLAKPAPLRFDDK